MTTNPTQQHVDYGRRAYLIEFCEDKGDYTPFKQFIVYADSYESAVSKIIQKYPLANSFTNFTIE